VREAREAPSRVAVTSVEPLLLDPSACYLRCVINVGETAPDFTAKTTTGATVRLADLRGKRVVLYFFPKAFTSG
jgi:AhpC/TSA family